MIIFDANRIGKKIAAARKTKNMTQNDLADQLSVSYQAVSNWERGQSVPDIDKYADLSQILDLSLDDLLNTADAAHKVTIVQDDTAKVDADTLKDFAPVMKPAQVDEKADDVDLSPDYLKDIAPFLSDEALFKQLMKHRDAPSFLQQVVAVAPFLADDDLNKIVEKYILPDFPGNSQLLAKLLPFMDERVANEVLAAHWADPDFDRKPGASSTPLSIQQRSRPCWSNIPMRSTPLWMRRPSWMTRQLPTTSKRGPLIRIWRPA